MGQMYIILPPFKFRLWQSIRILNPKPLVLQGETWRWIKGSCGLKVVRWKGLAMANEPLLHNFTENLGKEGRTWEKERMSTMLLCCAASSRPFQLTLGNRGEVGARSGSKKGLVPRVSLGESCRGESSLLFLCRCCSWGAFLLPILIEVSVKRLLTTHGSAWMQWGEGGNSVNLLELNWIAVQAGLGAELHGVCVKVVPVKFWAYYTKFWPYYIDVSSS